MGRIGSVASRDDRCGVHGSSFRSSVGRYRDRRRRHRRRDRVARLSPRATLTLAEEAACSQAWNDAVRHSLSSGKPALVLFTADWCPGCRWFEDALAEPKVRSYMNSRFTPIKVDLTQPDSPNETLAKQHG